MARDDPGFLGRGWHFPPDFDANTGQPALAEAEDDIAESLHILMGTRRGERIMHPTYGCRIHDLVFEIMDGETEAAIETAISEAILFFEPRITLHQVIVGTEDWLDGILRIRLDYSVDQTNSRSNIVFPFYLAEGTLLPGFAASGS
ncbi:GPW/gp25 family protein [Paracoccus marinaquae]|uniref:GPW/gp25 family protein n=1 Tax=Paracoccus marinaquae TaxID=2841926 RepID=A0ABS6AHP5_9RHOB|nr:GPW/gp25 family protein [Paracoccus marinaquae]MBU3030121.1 GPW/gp25 family protein [Paracoccus marinaquae]